MKIAWVLAGGLHPSGREQMTPAILHLLERLARRHEVHAFTVRHLPEPATYTLHGIHVHDLGRPRDHGSFGRWSESRPLLAAMTTHGPFDVVHGYQADPGILAAWAGRRFGIPSIVTCDSGEFVALPYIQYGMQRSLRTRALVAAACRLATHVHVTTWFMEKLAFRHCHRAVCFPFGVDAGAFAGGAGVASVDGPPWKLLNVASINRVKDHRTLIDGVGIALERGADVHLDIVGEDTLGGTLQQYVTARGLSYRVTFHGYRPFDELPAFYHAAHLYVHSSRHEAAGAVFLEAAAAGLPIVSTSVGYASDLGTLPGSTRGAVVVEPAHPRALARAIIETLQDAPLRIQMAATAWSFAQQHDVDWTAGELERLYAQRRQAP
jgi:glycosyltransferase involved in cell wall biosynthesis